MRQLTMSTKEFINYLPELIKSGVTFEATETGNNSIIIEFTGGY